MNLPHLGNGVLLALKSVVVHITGSEIRHLGDLKVMTLAPLTFGHGTQKSDGQFFATQ